jgi:lipopolysaccharide/colanic/teichoic acid biosynthesis glycosyltransferase
MIKRLFDVVVASIGLIVFSPLLLLIAAWVKLDSSGPVFFRQERVGRHGDIFRIHKFRTMVSSSEKRGLLVTVGKDIRITKSGVVLRKLKLDELPQLIDVIQGRMSLVGPRPEVPKYVAHYPERSREIVLSVRPGITDSASIEFRQENEMLMHSQDPEKDYIEKILPIKLQHYERYVTQRSLALDIAVIFRTVKSVWIPRN